MRIGAALRRASRGFRDDVRLHVVSVTSLTIAFLCLGAALLGVTHLSRVADAWKRAQHLTLYLAADAKPSDLAQLRLVLESLAEVEKVEHVTAERAREEFLGRSDLAPELAGLPADAFPASLEVTLKEGASPARVAEIAERVQSFRGIEAVETYRDWFAQMAKLTRAGTSAAGLFATLVVVCVLGIIGNTIRLAIANRRREIEVLKLCGATNAFVRAPFLIEGAMQAATAALVSIVLLLGAHLALRGHLDAAQAALTGVRLAFLHPAAVGGIVLGATLLGALGSGLALRRHLAV